jgi:hypothetical protein
MYINEKILVGKNSEKEAYILPKMANRHGIISGASGSGKTITLKVLAESFSDAGVPVFLVDVKGDLAGTSFKGLPNDNINSRIENLKLDGFEFKKFPTTFWDLYGKFGHPIRTTVENVGAKLLSKMLGLSDAQEGNLAIAFKIAADENMSLIELEDLRSLLTYIGNKRTEYSLTYGNITTQSLGTIQRNILALQEEGGDYFFGKPDFEIKDLIHFDGDTGRGQVNMLDARVLFQKPNLYSTFLLWMLTYVYNNLPEVGDLEKPKLVMFIDEAHLLFDDIPKTLLTNITQIVKLIRSKGVGLYFISQSPSDIPDEILAQLGNRIQHVLRYYTENDEKAIKTAAKSFRINPNLNTVEEIKNLGTGVALVSFQDEKGMPEMVEKVTILPPQSAMGAIDDDIRLELIQRSYLFGKYETSVNLESAKEKVDKIINEENEKKKEIEEAKQKELEEKQRIKEEKEKAKEEAALEKQRLKEEKEAQRAEALKKKEEEKKKKEEEKAKKNSIEYKLGKKVVNKATNKVIDKGLNKLLKGIFK